MKKVALIKIGARISFKDEEKMSSTLVEVLATLKLLSSCDMEVDIYTKKSARDKDHPVYDVYDLKTNWFNINMKDYDALFIVNGSVPFYGGKDGNDDIFNYKIINCFEGKMFYMLFDPYLGLKQIHGNIAKKEDYKIHAEDTRVTRDDITYITQCQDTSEINELGQQSVHYFPLQQFPLYMSNIYPEYNSYPPVEELQRDLTYCGSFRGGRRQEDMIEYYFGSERSTIVGSGYKDGERFSKKKVGNLIYPKFEKPVKQKQVAKEMRKGLATVIIGDPLYIKHYDIAQRLYECVLANVITFIDKKLDPEMRTFNQMPFFYVTSKEDLYNKLAYLYQSEDNRLRYLKMQKEVIINSFDFNLYSADFRRMLEVI